MRSNLISKKRLQKTEFSWSWLEILESFRPKNFTLEQLETRPRLQNPAIGGLFKIETVIFSKIHTGWLATQC